MNSMFQLVSGRLFQICGSKKLNAASPCLVLVLGRMHQDNHNISKKHIREQRLCWWSPGRTLCLEKGHGFFFGFSRTSYCYSILSKFPKYSVRSLHLNKKHKTRDYWTWITQLVRLHHHLYVGKDLVHWSTARIKATLLFLNPLLTISWSPHFNHVSFPWMCDPSIVRRHSVVRGESANLYLFQMPKQECSVLYCSETMQKSCGKLTRFSPVTQRAAL